MRRRGWLLLALLTLAPPAAALELGEFPELAEFIDEMVARHSFSAAQLRALFAQVELKADVLEAIERPAEARPWYEYRQRFVNPEHVARGVHFWQQHSAALARAESEYGVPPEIIVALIGVETHYGHTPGRYRVADALTTLMLRHPPRAAFFRRELEEFLLLAHELGVAPLRIKGSYAGAMGIPQFIPSSYRRYAVDFDADGRRDLLGNPVDAIGSVANFLTRHGWQTRGPVSDEVRIEGTRYFWVERLGLKPTLTLEQLIGYGIFPARNSGGARRAALIGLEGEDGPLYRLGYDNFYVITRYNRSKRYAMAVHELAELLRADYDQP